MHNIVCLGKDLIHMTAYAQLSLRCSVLTVEITDRELVGWKYTGTTKNSVRQLQQETP